MSEPAPAKDDKPGVSPLRRILGLVLLFVVVVIAWLQLSAVYGYNNAVKALDTRAQDETKTLLTTPEAEALLGKTADGPGEDVTLNNQTFSKKTYTWQGALKSYKLTAFYTKQAEPKLHHFETDGAQLPAEAPPTAGETAKAPSTDGTAPLPPASSTTTGAERPASSATTVAEPPASTSAPTTPPDEAAKKKPEN